MKYDNNVVFIVISQSQKDFGVIDRLVKPSLLMG
jgi:hypothetical protein